MHVVFVSCCEKKALKRTRTLLDSYAKRTGDHTWLTPITTEGLSELRKALRKTATRQTSVACFRNDGMKRMRLLWIVGNNKYFDKHGTSPIATTLKKRITTMPEWAKLCALIAETAGFIHDLGKFNQEFQNKLEKKGPIKDNVRHEWLSMFLAQSLLDGIDWLEATQILENRKPEFSDPLSKEKTLVFEHQLYSITDTLLYCVATHHKLPSKERSRINDGEHVNHRSKDGMFKNPKISFMPNENLIKLIQRNIKKLQEHSEKAPSDDPTYWRAIATFSRMALILADQTISAECRPAKLNNEAISIAYANTTKNGEPNQELCWHLEKVGFKAGEMIFHMLNISLPHLSIDAVEHINQPARGERYLWQNKAGLALENSHAKHDTPHLVLNIAGTGSGKTRMNLRVICALNADKPVRVATALNLRTLTLQTGDAYHQQLGIGKDEMACVIGDSLVQKLHESGQRNVDEDEDEYGIDVNSDVEYEMPEWLKFYTVKNTKLNDVIGAPILVSTIDFLIAAGEPHRKHHHILAALRIMHSDLILDEIDGYEPKALLSVLRLVTASAMFGRNVVASSATLSKPVAKMLWQAYEHGANMRALLYQQPLQFKTAVIDDLVKPHIDTHKDVAAFMMNYEAHVGKMMQQLEGKAYRVPVLAKITSKDKTGWLNTITEWANTLHHHHAWIDDKTSKRISFGLVRIANIGTAIEVAKHLSKTLTNAKIVCYHANHFLMQRFYIEQRLDFLLNRKQHSHAHIVNDKEIRAIIEGAESDVQFIVVATPVEEIGRDHDFDWAIIEPSSSQSIVQTAGRVNRHRLAHLKHPNIVLLQYCYKEAIGTEGYVFTRPGLETKGASTPQKKCSTHPSHDLNELFDWSQLRQIDARMRFCSDIHLFAKYDDEAIEIASASTLKSMLTEDHLWMAKETYTESSLRSLEPTLELRLDDLIWGEKYHMSAENFNNGEKKSVTIRAAFPRAHNDWLIKTDQELLDYAQQYNLPAADRAITVSISFYAAEFKNLLTLIEEKVCRHQSFGFYINR